MCPALLAPSLASSGANKDVDQLALVLVVQYSLWKSPSALELE